MSRPRLIALLLALVTLVVYLPVTRHDFIHYDDDDYIINNRVVQNGLTLAGVRWAFTTGYASNWHPVTWLSHMMDCELFDLNAGAHHVVNVLFHSANSALLFVFLLRLTEKIWPSAMVAALFAWHPLHVESVAWVSERKDVLSTFFALLALLSYARYAQKQSRVEGQTSSASKASPALDVRPSTLDYSFALVFFALGVMSKPMLVTLPFVMLLLDFWPLQRMVDGKNHARVMLQLIAEKWPFFLLTLASCIITFLVQKKAESSLEQIPLAFRLENAVTAASHYLVKMFWPAGLAVIYPLAPISPVIFGLAAIILLLISAAVWSLRRTHSYFVVGWFWFLGTLVPVIGLVQVGGTAMADRYTYIPSIGIFMAFAFGLYGLSERLRWPKAMLPAISMIISIVCIALTEKQLSYWRDSETLFHHALAVTKNNDAAHHDLGFAFELEGRPEEALAEYREAVRLNPYHYQLHFSIGNMLEKTGHPEEALAEYHQCLQLDPGIPALHNAAGRVLAALGNPEAAFKEFAEAERLDAHFGLPHIETAKILFQQGNDAKAVDELWVAARIEPYNPDVLTAVARYLAANQNASARDGPNALALALKADELTHGRQPEVFDVLGMAFAETGDFSNAVSCAQSALGLAISAKFKNTEPIRQRLELYESHQAWRESFQTNHAPMKEQPRDTK
jgi:Flp pilus assembly protein TadD